MRPPLLSPLELRHSTGPEGLKARERGGEKEGRGVGIGWVGWRDALGFSHGYVQRC